MGKHIEFVFTYKGKPVQQCATKAWRNALKRAKIEDFSGGMIYVIHGSDGTSLYELQKLGGWSSYETVQRYSHLNSEQLQEAAERACTNLVHDAFK